MAGRAALATRANWPDAITHFLGLINDTNCPANLRFQAMFAYGDTLISQDSTNRVEDYAIAIKVFRSICRDYPTNRQVFLAYGQEANCQLQWAALTHQPEGLTNALAAYQQVITSTNADASARSMAQVGQGAVLEKMAEPLKTGSERKALLEAALSKYPGSLLWHQSLPGRAGRPILDPESGAGGCPAGPHARVAESPAGNLPLGTAQEAPPRSRPVAGLQHHQGRQIDGRTMLAAQTGSRPEPMTEAEHRATFFRHSGWLMLATVASGALMWAVHFLSHRTRPGEYGLFVAYLALVMSIPVAPLQMVMAQQTAKALATNKQAELAGMTRRVWLGTFLLWLMGVAVVWVLRDPIMARFKVTNHSGLWITVLVLLFALWLPLFQGVLQGKQDFLWLGWSVMSNGIGRLGVATLAVMIFGGLAAGMMVGVLFGTVFAVLIAIWQTRSLWLAPARPLDWSGLGRQVLPLVIGSAVVQFLFTGDTLFVKAYFPENQVNFYGSAGTLSRALMWVVVPLATVMFPRLVHTSVRGEKSNLLGLVLAGTTLLSILGVLGLSVLGPIVVQIVNGQKYVAAASLLLPWYAAAMVPLCLANVLVSALFARSAFRIVPWLCVLAMGYVFGLVWVCSHARLIMVRQVLDARLVMVLQVVGLCNLVLLALGAWFTWTDNTGDAASSSPAPAALT